MLVSSFILYLLFEFDKDRVVIQAIGPYTSEEQRQAWLSKRIYEPFFDAIRRVGRAWRDFGTRSVQQAVMRSSAEPNEPGSWRWGGQP